MVDDEARLQYMRSRQADLIRDNGAEWFTSVLNKVACNHPSIEAELMALMDETPRIVRSLKASIVISDSDSDSSDRDGSRRPVISKKKAATARHSPRKASEEKKAPPQKKAVPQKRTSVQKKQSTPSSPTKVETALSPKGKRPSSTTKQSSPIASRESEELKGKTAAIRITQNFESDEDFETAVASQKTGPSNHKAQHSPLPPSPGKRAQQVISLAGGKSQHATPKPAPKTSSKALPFPSANALQNALNR